MIDLEVSHQTAPSVVRPVSVRESLWCYKIDLVGRGNYLTSRHIGVASLLPSVVNVCQADTQVAEAIDEHPREPILCVCV